MEDQKPDARFGSKGTALVALIYKIKAWWKKKQNFKYDPLLYKTLKFLRYQGHIAVVDGCDCEGQDFHVGDRVYVFQVVEEFNKQLKTPVRNLKMVYLTETSVRVHGYKYVIFDNSQILITLAKRDDMVIKSKIKE